VAIKGHKEVSGLKGASLNAKAVAFKKGDP
jgi:hypothetical protein